MPGIGNLSSFWASEVTDLRKQSTVATFLDQSNPYYFVSLHSSVASTPNQRRFSLQQMEINTENHTGHSAEMHIW